MRRMTLTFDILTSGSKNSERLLWNRPYTCTKFGVDRSSRF